MHKPGVVIPKMSNYSHLKESYSSFILSDYYVNYESLLTCFDLKSEKHLGTGSEIVYYKKDYEYPYEADGGKFKDYLMDKLKSYQFLTDLEFEKAWWVDYPKHSYAGFHCHKHHNKKEQLTTVVFLTSSQHNEINPFQGYLYMLIDNKYEEVKPSAGKFHTFNGNAWHGTYPTLDPRKVFVCDVSFNYVF